MGDDYFGEISQWLLNPGKVFSEIAEMLAGKSLILHPPTEGGPHETHRLFAACGYPEGPNGSAATSGNTRRLARRSLRPGGKIRQAKSELG